MSSGNNHPPFSHFSPLFGHNPGVYADFAIPLTGGPMSHSDFPMPMDDMPFTPERDLWSHGRNMIDEMDDLDPEDFEWPSKLRAFPSIESEMRRVYRKHIVSGTRSKLGQRQWHMPVVLMAITSSLPEDQLRKLSNRTAFHPGPESFDMVQFMVNVSELAKIYFQHAAILPRMTQKGAECIIAAGHQCVLTGATSAKVSYIFPAAANKTQESMDLLKRYELELAILTNGRHYLFLEELNCVDRLWNMLPLDRKLHKWWARGYFGLRYKETTPVEDPFQMGGSYNVTMTLFWLPRQKATPRETKTRNEDGRIVVREQNSNSWLERWEDAQKYDVPANKKHLKGVYDDEVAIAMAHPATRERLKSGSEFTVLCETRKDARNMHVMLDLQWTLQQVASMCSATTEDKWYVDADPMQEEEERQLVLVLR